MKGDIGMAQNMRKEETRGHYTANTRKAKRHHPYIFVLLIHRQKASANAMQLCVSSIAV